MFKKYFSLILRIGLAAVLLFGGIMKLFMADKAQLLQSLTDPRNGFLSSYFLTFISSPLGFIQVVGWFQIILGIVILLGLFTQLFAIVTGVLSWIAIILSPVLPAEIRMQKYIAFTGLCFALAYMGAGPYSFDSLLKNTRNLKLMPAFRMVLGLLLLIGGIWLYNYLSFAPVWNFLLAIACFGVPLAVIFVKSGQDDVLKGYAIKFNRDVAGMLLRLSLAFPMMATAIFFVSFNTFPGMPQLLLLAVGVFLLLGLFTRLFALVAIVILLIQIFMLGPAAGADFALLGAALILLFMGGGRFNIVNKIKE